MSEKLLPCPFCGGEAVMVKTQNCGRYVGCLGCGARTEETETDYAGSAYGKAIAAWNRRAQESELPTNDALTRDELYYLDGEPLYVMDGEGHECYCVVNTKNEDCIDNEAGAWCFEFYDMTGDGKHGLHKMGWRAYRTKPERSEG